MEVPGSGFGPETGNLTGLSC